MSDVDEPWSDIVDVAEMTETDFQRRYAPSMVYEVEDDPVLELLCGIAADGMISMKEAADRALRVYIAHLIDEGVVGFTREDYDIKSLIPPTEGVTRRMVDDSNDYDDDRLSFDMPTAVKEMADATVEEGIYESLSALYRDAIRWYAGRDTQERQ